MKTRFLLAAAGAMLISGATNAQAQTQPQQSDILGQLLGAVFGTSPQASEQTMETDWNQGRKPFAQRRAALDARIDAAVRAGTMNRGEAEQMRREYDDIVRLEAQYSADGNVSQQQRTDLRSRYRALIQRVDDTGYGDDGQADGNEGGYDEQYGRWPTLATRSADFEARVAAGLRSRSLSQTEANQLRANFRSVAQIETDYARGGISAREEADLRARYDALDARVGNVGSGSGSGNDRNTARWTLLETRLASAERAGRITRTEAVQVRAQLGDLARLDAVYAVGGYSADQRSYLTRRYADLDAALGYNRR
ncbi:hypothetical protein [Sandarakinorhabdus glacialis]|nr:hypothetical protein [Polymorphobacter glacialis]